MSKPIMFSIILLSLQGFWKTLACGELDLPGSGIITTPNYPSSYGNLRTCRWTIYPSSHCVIQLVFTNFHVEDCCDPFTLAYTGFSQNYYGTSLNGQTRYAKGNVDLKFSSDSSYSPSGVRIVYSTICQPDMDECVTGLHTCPSGSSCVDTSSSFTCVCRPGYQYDGYNTCEDINECNIGADNCHVDANCANTVGSFSCTCKSGYTGSGLLCSDIDECSRGEDNCHKDGFCTNTDGSFKCACNSGYVGDGVHCKLNLVIFVEHQYSSTLNGVYMVDEDNHTCVNFTERPSPKFTLLQMDMVKWPNEGIARFYFRVTHHVIALSLSEWITVYSSTTGVQKSGQDKISRTEKMRICLEASSSVDTIVITCDCPIPCSVYINLSFLSVKDISICEIEPIRTLT